MRRLVPCADTCRPLSDGPGDAGPDELRRTECKGPGWGKGPVTPLEGDPSGTRDYFGGKVPERGGGGTRRVSDSAQGTVASEIVHCETVCNI